MNVYDVLAKHSACSVALAYLAANLENTMRAVYADVGRVEDAGHRLFLTVYYRVLINVYGSRAVLDSNTLSVVTEAVRTLDTSLLLSILH